MAKSGADRVKRYQVAAKERSGEKLSPDEEAFRDSYDESKGRPALLTDLAQLGAGNMSASERKLTLEERGVATGTHEHPDLYSNLARAEGLRADTLLRIVAQSLITVNDQYFRLMLHLSERNTAIEEKHVELLEAVRTHYIARAEAEVEAIEAEHVAAMAGDDDELAKFLRLIQIAQARGAKKEDGEKAKVKGKKKAQSRGTPRGFRSVVK